MDIFGVSFADVAFPFGFQYNPPGEQQAFREAEAVRLAGVWPAKYSLPIGICDWLTKAQLESGALPVIDDFITVKGGKNFNLLAGAPGFQGNQCIAVLLARLTWNGANEYVVSAGSNVKFVKGKWIPDPADSSKKPAGGQVHAEMMAFGGLRAFLQNIDGKTAKVQVGAGFVYEQKTLKVADIVAESWLTISMKSMCTGCAGVHKDVEKIFKSMKLHN